MNKVLVDRELLEKWTDKLEGADSAGYGWEDLLAAEIRGAIAQPAESEGVEVVAYATPNEDGDWQMLFFDEKEAFLYVDDERPAPLILQSDHRAALSAVTAERDGLAAARMAYANEFAPDENGDPDVGNVHANIRALKAERDRLLSDNASLRGSCKALGEENKQLKRENKRQGRTITAMAAKEA